MAWRSPASSAAVHTGGPDRSALRHPGRLAGDRGLPIIQRLGSSRGQQTRWSAEGTRGEGAMQVAEATERPAQINDFVIRRLHSLLGIIPVGAFLAMHLTVNMLIVSNTPENDYYQQAVDRIHGLGPFLAPTEIVFIFIPLALHAGLGVKIWFEGRSNTRAYPFWGNVRYMLQRTTGLIALVFILVHLWQMHWTGGWLPGGDQFDPHAATATAADALQRYWWAAPLYAIGVLASVFHFANGIWAFLITWGVTIGPKAQRGAGYVCAGLGVMLALAGLASVRGLMTYPVPQEKGITAETRSRQRGREGDRAESRVSYRSAEHSVSPSACTMTIDAGSRVDG